MRRRLTRGLLALGCVAAVACIDPLMGPEPDPDDPLENFDILWSEFDRHYAFFELKGIDWAAARDTHRPRLGPGTTEEELLDVVSDMLDELRDGHVNVFTDVGVYGYTAWFADRPVSYVPLLVRQRVSDLATVPDGTITYGWPETGIGYVHVPSFQGGLAYELDLALTALGPLDGLIVDLRHNGGGSDREAREMAGRLVDARRLYRTVRYRNGPEHDDFTPHIPSYVEPMGASRFDGPVVLLTNRRTYSAAESFVLAVRTRSAFTEVVGDTTGGGSGFPMFRELPNGWTYRIPRWIAYDAQGRPFEGVGLAPDHHEAFDATAESDPILNRAIRLLREAGSNTLDRHRERG